MSRRKGKVLRTRPGDGAAQYMFPQKHEPTHNRELAELAAEARKAGMSYGKFVARKELGK